MVYDWCLWSVLLTTLVSTIWKKLRSSVVQLQWSKTTHPQTYWSVDRYLLDYGCPTSKYNHNKHHSISNHDFGLYPYYSSLVKPWSLITLLFLLTSDPTVNHQRLACPAIILQLHLFAQSSSASGTLPCRHCLVLKTTGRMENWMTILGVQPSHFGQKLGGTTQTSSKSFGRHPEKNNTFFWRSFKTSNRNGVWK